MENGNGGLGKVIQVKSWQVFLTVVFWLVSAVASYTTLRADADESKRRIRDLETRPVVTEQQYLDGQKYLADRLTRIENKLDMLDDLQQIDKLQRHKSR
jgi:hypothetical protein